MTREDSRKIEELHTDMQGIKSDMESTKTDMQWVKKVLGNHLKHHEKYEYALITGILLLVAKQLFLG